MADTKTLAEALATAAAGAFTGAALFVSAVEHPAAMKTSVNDFYRYFPASYKRASKVQGGLALLGSSAAFAAALQADDRNYILAWGASGALLLSIWPFTLFGMMPTIKKIISQDTVDANEQTNLLTRWGKLHSVRTLLSATSFAVMIATLAQRRASAS